MVRSTIVNVDRATGEVLDGSLVYMPVKRRNGFREGWCAMGVDGFLHVARAGLSGEVLRVYLGLLHVMGFGNDVEVTQADLARLLRIRPQAVNRAYRVLESRGLIRAVSVPRGALPPLEIYRVSPHVVWRGDAKDHRLALNEWDAATPVAPAPAGQS